MPSSGSLLSWLAPETCASALLARAEVLAQGTRAHQPAPLLRHQPDRILPQLHLQAPRSPIFERSCELGLWRLKMKLRQYSIWLMA